MGSLATVSIDCAGLQTTSPLATCNMGPIMQERTASTTLKRVVSKEKIRVKNTENSGPVTSSKKGNKMKKAVGQMRNGLPGPGQDKDTLTTVQRGAQSKGGRVKSGTARNTGKLSRYVWIGVCSLNECFASGAVNPQIPNCFSFLFLLVCLFAALKKKEI